MRAEYAGMRAFVIFIGMTGAGLATALSEKQKVTSFIKNLLSIGN
jgi:hypothetical protein